jgi:hypothetical protein
LLQGSFPCRFRNILINRQTFHAYNKISIKHKELMTR